MGTSPGHTSDLHCIFFFQLASEWERRGRDERKGGRARDGLTRVTRIASDGCRAPSARVRESRRAPTWIRIPQHVRSHLLGADLARKTQWTHYRKGSPHPLVRQVTVDFFFF